MPHLKISDGSTLAGDLVEDMKLHVTTKWHANSGKHICTVKDRDGRIIAKAEHYDQEMVATHAALNEAAKVLKWEPPNDDPVDRVSNEVDELRRQLKEANEKIDRITGGRTVSMEGGAEAPKANGPPPSTTTEKFETDDEPEPASASPGNFEADDDDEDDAPPPPPPPDVNEEQTASEVLGVHPRKRHGKK